MTLEGAFLALVYLFLVVAVLHMSRLAVHTQQHLARLNERDRLIDALVWIGRHTSFRKS